MTEKKKIDPIHIACPYCNAKISSVSDGTHSYLPQTCSHIQRLDSGIWDCIGKNNCSWNAFTPYDAGKLLETAKTIGWQEALYQGSIAEAPSILNYNKADWFFYLPNTITTCLAIGCGFGTIPFILSEWVKEVWLLEQILEHLEFQAIRAKQEQKTNLHFIRSKLFPLPFPDNSFDLVSINGVLEWIGFSDLSKNPRNLQREFLREVYRVLQPDGVVYIGVENRFGFQYPRVKNDYRTYTYIGYQKFLKDCGFDETEFYWALPGYSDTRWSGKLDEKESLAFFVQKLEKKEVVEAVQGSLKKLFAGIVLSSWGKGMIDLFINTGLYKFFMPSYLIFAYKEKKQQLSFEEQLKSVRQREHSAALPLRYLRRNNRGKKVKLTFYGVDKKKQLRELAMTTRFSEHEDLLKKEQQGQMFNSTLPVINTYSISGRDVITLQPLKGTKADFYAEQDIVRSIDWLRDFHRTTAQGRWKIPELERFFHRYLEPIYQTMKPFVDRFMTEIQKRAYYPRKVGEHGDFCTQNILILNEQQGIYVVDWEFYNPTGDELFDFVKLIVDIFPDFVRESGKKKFQSFAKREPVKTYIDYFVKRRKISPEIVVSYIPLCFGRVAVRHYVQSGKNKYFLRYMSLLEEEVSNFVC